METQTPKIAYHATFLSAFLALVLVAGPGWAEGRDSDGSRMQARKVKVGASESDSLSPPSDKADWRYFKLDSTKSVTISVNASVDKATISVSMTSATGKSIVSSRATGSPVTVQKELDPGIYYFSVESNHATDYTVQID